MDAQELMLTPLIHTTFGMDHAGKEKENGDIDSHPFSCQTEMNLN